MLGTKGTAWMILFVHEIKMLKIFQKAPSVIDYLNQMPVFIAVNAKLAGRYMLKAIGKVYPSTAVQMK